MKTQANSEQVSFSTFLVSWKNYFKWQEIQSDRCVCVVLVLIIQQGFSAAFIMLVVTEILKQHLKFFKTLYVELRARAANFTSSKPRG